MKQIFAFALLLLLIACAPQEPVQPVMQPPQAVVVPPVQVITEPSDTIEKIEIKPGSDPQTVSVAAGNDPQTINVDIVEFRYEPAQVKVKVGDTVVWTQVDKVKHTVTVVSGPENFDSGLLTAGQTFSHTFTIPGEYSYKCTPHPNMRGKVIVE